MSSTVIVVIALAIGVPLLLGLLFKWLWKVPAAAESFKHVDNLTVLTAPRGSRRSSGRPARR
jgi:hypothetical protein